MNSRIVLGACALFLVACTKNVETRVPSSPAPATPAAAVATDAKAVFVLGRTVCEHCESTVRGALGKVDGVGEIAIAVGAPDFTVHYDSRKLKPADIVAKLHAAGEKDAKVKS